MSITYEMFFKWIMQVWMTAKATIRVFLWGFFLLLLQFLLHELVKNTCPSFADDVSAPSSSSSFSFSTFQSSFSAFGTKNICEHVCVYIRKSITIFLYRTTEISLFCSCLLSL